VAHLKIRLFGSFQVHLNEAPITKFESNKVRALLAYLVVESRDSHSREQLAALFWLEMPAKRANSNLSQALYNLRHLIQDHQANPPFLLRSRDSVQFNRESDYWLDIEQFNQNLIQDQVFVASNDGYHENLQRAIDLYRGDFLEGLSFDSSLTFDEWLLVQRQRAQRQVLNGLHHLAAYYRGRNELPRALSFAWRQVELDPLDERACRQLMGLLAANNQRSQALTQFERLQVMLAEELGITPEPETQALRDQIQGKDHIST
jgi:DNA-binding SARP family transcriptional activator